MASILIITGFGNILNKVFYLKHYTFMVKGSINTNTTI
jgi:hypothetical protein